MYLYLYDHFLNHKKHSGTLARIETRLTDLGIGGKIFRLSPLRDLKELMADEIGQGAKTVVVVGNDKTLSQVINVLAKYDVILGMIPIGPENKIAHSLGIPDAEKACDTLAARIIENVDLGKINNFYFISGLEVKDGSVTIECENNYRITSQKQGSLIGIYNLRPATASVGSYSQYFNPKDGFLEIFIKPIDNGFLSFFKKNIKESIIPFKYLEIKGRDSASVITDGQKVIKPPIRIEVAPKKLKIIVGKNRIF